MRNSEVLEIVEHALHQSGLLITRVGNMSPAVFNDNDHPDIPAGEYRSVDVIVLVPERG